MRGLLVMLSAAVALLAVPQLVAAAEPPGPGPFNPEVMFQRLDANRDGVITADEVPAGAPDRIKQFLIRADKSGDKKVTKEEFAAAAKERGQFGRGPGGRTAEARRARPWGRSRLRPTGTDGTAGRIWAGIWGRVWGPATRTDGPAAGRQGREERQGSEGLTRQRRRSGLRRARSP